MIYSIFVQSSDLHRSFADVIFCPGSDHLLLIGTINHPVKKLRKKVITRLMKRENLQKLSKEISIIDWSPLFEEKEYPSRALNSLMSVILPIYERACLLKTIKSKKLVPRQPWMSMEIIDKIALRNRLYKRYLDDRRDEAFNLFKTRRNLVNKPRRNAISNLGNHRFEEGLFPFVSSE